MVGSTKRVYYDTNMWVAYTLGKEDAFFSSCAPLFYRVERGLDFVTVSRLVVAETIHALRKLTTGRFGPTPTPDHASIRSECRLIEECFLDYVAGLMAAKNAEIVEPSASLSHHQRRVLSKIHRYYGRITGGSHNKCRYAGLGHVDVEHAYLALEAEASEFYTTDKGFGDLRNDPRFAGISFEILEKGR